MKISFIPQLIIAVILYLPINAIAQRLNSNSTDSTHHEHNHQLQYQPSETRLFDLLHTKLEVSFDWEKQYLIGIANLKLKPYFYPQSELILDAKGMDVHRVLIKSDTSYQKVNFEIHVLFQMFI